MGKTTGRLHTFIIEPFCTHTDADELYVAIFSQRHHDVIMFYEHGGVDIGDVDQKVSSIRFTSDFDAHGGCAHDLRHKIMRGGP